MKAFGFAEHGSVFEWVHKKNSIEEAGMKYIHGCECYLTAGIEEKINEMNQIKTTSEIRFGVVGLTLIDLGYAIRQQVQPICVGIAHSEFWNVI